MKYSDLYQYQIYAADFIRRQRKCALFLDMGLGKTVSTLTAISDFLDDFFIKKVLIVAPLRVCNTVWKQEAEKWSHLESLKISICTGNLKKRKEALLHGDVHIINFENLQWLSQQYKRWPYDMVILDESSAFKSSKSIRFRTLRKVSKYIKSIVLLTGTPSPNSLIDIWTQIFLIDSGKRLGRTMANYRNRFFTQSGFMGYSYKVINGEEERIYSLLSDICLTMKAEDYIQLPERIDINRYVEMSKETSEVYKELQKEFIVNLKNGVDIESPTSAVLANKLLQICNGAVYDIDKNINEIHDDKIVALKEIIEDNPSENFLISYNYKSDLSRLKLAFPKAVILDKNGSAVSQWNQGKIKILLAHPASAGHGLNLQSGGSCIVWFGLNWSLELYQQFNARLHRQGQTKPVKIIHLVMKGGIDEKVLNVLSRKAKNQKELLDYLKVELFS